MSKYVMVVQSLAKAGQDAEYNNWYDNTHLPDITDIPGISSGRRFEFSGALAGEPGLKYLAIYEIETDDIDGVAAELGKRSIDGTIRHSDTLDGPASVLWFYKQNGT